MPSQGKSSLHLENLKSASQQDRGLQEALIPLWTSERFFTEIAEVSWYLEVVRSQGDLYAPLWELLTSVLWIPHFSVWCSEYLSFSRKSPWDCLVESAAREALEDLSETRIHGAKLST